MIASGPLANRPPHILLVISFCSFEKGAAMTAGLPEKDRPPGFLRAGWLAAGALALVVLSLVLYGTRPQGGKDQVLASLCPVSTGLTGKLQPLIHGEIAALMLAPEPKPMPALTFDGPDGKEISLAGRRCLHSTACKARSARQNFLSSLLISSPRGSPGRRPFSTRRVSRI